MALGCFASDAGIEPSVPAVPIQEGLQRAAQLRRQVVILDGAQQRDRGFVGFELRHAARATREVLFESDVDLWRELVLHVIRQQAHEIIALLHR